MKDAMRYLVQIVVLLAAVLTIGTAGYFYLERDWTIAEAFYMTVITITTVGYGEVHALSLYGRVFTVVLIFLGWSVVAVFAAQFARLIVESGMKGRFLRTRMYRRVKRMKDHYIICGFGRIGKTICRELKKQDLSFVVIENDEDEQKNAEEEGYCVIGENATTDTALKAAGIERAAGVVAGLATDADNLFISLAARELNPKTLVISRAEGPGAEDRILRAGADIVASPITLGGQQIAQLITQPEESYQASSVLGYSLKVYRHEGGGATVAEAVQESHALSAVAVKREDGTLVIGPSAEVKVSSRDSVFMFTADRADAQGTMAKEREGRRILLVDDHKALRLLFARKIRSAGHDILTAASGEEALELAQEYAPELVILDVVMPGVSGYDTCQLIRKMPGLADVPVILYSDNESQEFLKRGSEAGATACLRKTSKSSELLSTIEELLQASSPSANTAAESSEAALSASAEDTPVLDSDQLLQATDGDLELIDQVTTLFVEDTQERLNRIGEAVTGGDTEETRKEAHAIKGAASSVGGMAVWQAAKELESSAKAGEIDNCRLKLDALRLACTRLEAELKSYGRKSENDSDSSRQQ